VNLQANMRNKQIFSAPNNHLVRFSGLICCVAAKFTQFCNLFKFNSLRLHAPLYKDWIVRDAANSSIPLCKIRVILQRTSTWKKWKYYFTN